MATKKKTGAAASRPIPEEKRGRRGHPVIEEKPELRALMVEWLKERPRPTLDQLRERVLNEGYEVGRTAIWEWQVDFDFKQAQRDLAFEMARQYNATSQDGEILDIETAIAMMANVEIYRELSDRVGQGMSAETAELLSTFYKLQTSSSNRERTKFYVTRGVKRAIYQLVGDLQDELKKHPEAQKIVVDALRKRLTEGG